MRVIREIEVGGRKFLVKEMTLAELRVWLEESARRSPGGVADEVFAERDLLIADLPAFANCQPSDLEGYAPSELVPLVDAILEVNAHFFTTWRRRMSEARRLMESPRTPLGDWPAVSPA